MTISLLRKLDKSGVTLGGAMGWFMHYFGRWWRYKKCSISIANVYSQIVNIIIEFEWCTLYRLTPTYAFVMMVYATLFHYFATGPFMLDVWYDSDSCKDSWWYSLLYINNFFNSSGYVSLNTKQLHTVTN